MRVLCAREAKSRKEASGMNEENMQSFEAKNESPKIDKKDLVLSLFAVLLSGCVLSGAIPASFIGLAVGALFAYTVIAVRNIGAVIQLLLISIIAIVLTFLPISGAIVLALMLGTGTLAWLFMTLPKYKWAPIILLAVAYGLGFLVSSNPVTPLLSFAFLPAAALMAWAHARDLGRTSTVLHTLLGFVVAVLATLCVLLWRTYGSVNYDALTRFINDIKDLFITIGAEAGKILWESVESASAQSALGQESLEQLRESFAQVFSESNLRMVADTIVGLTPALVIVPALIISYLSNVVLLRKYYNTEWRSRMTPAACSLTIGPATGLIYFICFLIMMFANKQSTFLMAIYNMCLILLPGLCLTGVNVILQNARRSKGFMRVASVLLLVAAVCCLGLSSFYFVALWGAYATITAALHQKIIQKMKDRDEK